VNCEQVNEAAGAYALGALPAEELREVEAHLAECNLHEEFVSLRATASLLAFAAVDREPPATLRSRILAAVAADPAVETDGHAPARPIALSLPARGPRGLRFAYALAAAMGLLALGLLVWNVTLLREDDNPQTVFVPQEVIVTAIAQPISLVGTVAAGPGAGSSVRYIEAGQVAILDASGLEQLQEGRTYQIWTLRGKDLAGVGLFDVGPDGSARVAFISPLSEGDTIAVTAEPAGGSAQPTSEPVFTIQVRKPS